MTTENVNNIQYVRLGQSGLKVSKLILYVLDRMLPVAVYIHVMKLTLRLANYRGCMSYGNASFASWVLGETEGAEVSITTQNKAYARVCLHSSYLGLHIGIEHIKLAYDLGINTFDTANVYSNGLSEVVVGKAIKQHNLPRDEIVVMTKVRHPVNEDPNGPLLVRVSVEERHKMRYANRYGLSRKVSRSLVSCFTLSAC